MMPPRIQPLAGKSATAAPTRRIIRDVTRELLRVPPRLTDRQLRFIQSPAFIRSADWARLRYDFMRDHDGRCQCCGHGTPDGTKVNVDHIHPRKSHPQLALTYANLQLLCAACNRGKGNRDRTDWRYRAPAIPTCPAAARRCSADPAPTAPFGVARAFRPAAPPGRITTSPRRRVRRGASGARGRPLPRTAKSIPTTGVARPRRSQAPPRSRLRRMSGTTLTRRDPAACIMPRFYRLDLVPDLFARGILFVNEAATAAAHSFNHRPTGSLTASAERTLSAMTGAALRGRPISCGVFSIAFRKPSARRR